MLSTRNSVEGDNYTVIALFDAERWSKACRFALINAMLFSLYSTLLWFVEADSLLIILSAPILFFIGSGVVFLFMIQSGGAIAATTWFVLGTGIFFGLGSLAAGLQFHPWTAVVYGSDMSYLIHANVLNACSTLIVLAASYPFSNWRRLKPQVVDAPNFNIMQIMQKYFPVILFFAAAGIILKYTLFPWADSLLLRSLMAKIYLFIPCCFLLLGLLWKSLDWKFRSFGAILLILEIFNGLLGLTKYHILASMIALVAGLLLAYRLGKVTISALLMVVIVFILISPLISVGRAHIDYNAESNSIATRLIMLDDTVTYLLDVADGVEDNEHKFPFAPLKKYAYSDAELAAATAAEALLRDEKYGSVIGRVKGLLIRLDLAPVQGYLLNEYNSGRAGKSIDGFWAVFIPRVFWQEKPIISRFGPMLHKEYFKDPNQVGSSLAPSYSAEAYWNYGPSGVVVISVLLGLAIGCLTRLSQNAMMGLDPAYFLIAFPVLTWACFVESWVVASYLGEFIIFIVLLIVMRLVIKVWDRLYDSVLAKDATQQVDNYSYISEKE